MTHDAFCSSEGRLGKMPDCRCAMFEFADQLLKPVLDETIKRIFALIEDKWHGLTVEKKVIEAKLGQHLKYVSSWSSQIQHYGMAAAAGTDGTTIALDLAVGARRFPYWSQQVVPDRERKSRGRNLADR
jgi:hypothetical protein